MLGFLATRALNFWVFLVNGHEEPFFQQVVFVLTKSCLQPTFIIV